MTLGCAAVSAHAQDWFQFEAGLGVSQTRDDGDDVWVQYGLPHSEHLTTSGLVGGVTGELATRQNFDLRYHVDYNYLGQISVTSNAVPDQDYSVPQHKVTDPVPLALFHSSGHVQGVSFLADLGYTWNGMRLGAQAGPWLYWQTWHVTDYVAGGQQIIDVSHSPTMQFGWVIGASLEWKSMTVAYRYFQEKQAWNPNPGIATGTHMVMATYRF